MWPISNQTALRKRWSDSFEYSNAGDNKKAAAELEKAYEKDQNNPEIQFNLAQAYENSGQVDRAVPLLREIIKKKGLAMFQSDSYYWVISHYELAKCLQRIGNVEESKKILSEFLDLWKNADSN